MRPSRRRDAERGGVGATRDRRPRRPLPIESPRHRNAPRLVRALGGLERPQSGRQSAAFPSKMPTRKERSHASKLDDDVVPIFLKKNLENFFLFFTSNFKLERNRRTERSRQLRPKFERNFQVGARGDLRSLRQLLPGFEDGGSLLDLEQLVKTRRPAPVAILKVRFGGFESVVETSLEECTIEKWSEKPKGHVLARVF